MTRVQTTSSDTVTLNGADMAEAIDQFIRRCHQDLADGTRLYTLVTSQSAVTHFDVRAAAGSVVPADLIAGASVAGVTLRADDRFLIVDDGDSQAGIWVVQNAVDPAVRSTDCDTVAALIAKPHVFVAAGNNKGRWFLLDDDTIVDITLASYTLVT